MTEEMLALGRRAVACKGWRWLPGMLRVWPFVVRKPVPQGVWSWLASDDDRARGFIESMPTERVERHPFSILGGSQWDDATERWVACIPDLSDAATLGCLLALVREAMNDERACVSWDHAGEAWMCEGMHEYEGKTYLGVFAEGSTYVEALVAALEAAP